MANHHHHHHHHRKPVVSPELAMASDLFDKFCAATTLKTILGHYRSLCEILHMKPTSFPQFYPKLKSKLCSWRAQALWNKFDKRANHKCYNRGKACPNTRVLIIGAGPCGLRAAIEAQLLGAKVVVIEKRDRISRNNVLHLWPFVIHDLRSLGAKKFFGKFCAGSIDHISIRQLQCILLKVALLLGVEIHEGISFELLIPPSSNDEERFGWRAKILPQDHPVSQYEFDVLIGADGKRNTLDGFKRKEFRGKLAIAITANFINYHSEAEARVEEISGVAYIFNQKFFKDLRQAAGIDLENIVYYKDDTHYFVMTAKKHSLLKKGVILNDYADTAKLLSIENISKEALMEYAREAADFSTDYKLPQLQFAVNHYGQPDVAMFDFTSMYAAENASRVVQEKGYKLLMCLVGDSLLEPFWPTGSGCARGFLSSMDACWVIRSWGSSSCVNPLEVLRERESIYRLLNQTTPENLSRDITNYMLDPHSRYPNLNTRSVLPNQVKGLYTSDDPAAIEQCLRAPTSLVSDNSKKRRRKDAQIHHDVLLSWLKRQVALYSNIHIEDTNKSFKDGLALCAIIHRYRPDLIDFHSLKSSNSSSNNQLAFDVLEKEYGILPVMTGIEMENCEVPDNLTILSYLMQVYDIFRGEIPYSHHRTKNDENMESSAMINQTLNIRTSLSKVTHSQKLSLLSRLSGIPRKRYRESRSPTSLNKKDEMQVRRKSKKRKSGTSAAFIDRDVKEVHEFKKNPLEENFSGRIKDIETKLKDGNKLHMKPKDLFRAIGKIEKTDWNFKEIEKKIEENKHGRGIPSSAAKVPKWNRQQFDDKFTAVKKKLIGRADSTEAKYAEVDDTLKRLDQKLKNGSVLEQGQRGANKVSAMAAQLTTLNQQSEGMPLQKWGSKSVVICNQRGSEICHFCSKRVYLMERLSTEGRFFHRGCFRCEYCGISLRLGNYNFDRDGRYGSRFYCAQHFGYSGVQKSKRKDKMNDNKNNEKDIEYSRLPKTPVSLKGKFLNDMTDTPERLIFENSDIDKEESGHVSINEMDEDEWTDHNFGASANELASSDDVSEISESDEDNEDEFAQALDIPSIDNNESLEFTRRFSINSYSRNVSDDSNHKLNHDKDSDSSGSDGEDEHNISYHEFESEEDTATGDEACNSTGVVESQNICLQIPERIAASDSGSETEVASDEYSLSSNNEYVKEEDDNDTDDDEEEDEDDGEDTDDDEDDNDSATEISTDSEFERNSGSVIKSEIPDIIISESLPTRSGHFEEIRTIQVINKNVLPEKGAISGSKTEILVQPTAALDTGASIEPKQGLPFVNPYRGDYYLSRTRSTEGVASKISHELKKKYLLGDHNSNSQVEKSGSTSTLDTKFKFLVDQISEHQKLLNLSPEPSKTIQTFLETTVKLRNSSVISPTSATLIKSKELTGLQDFPHVCQSNNIDSVSDTSQNNCNRAGTDTSQTTSCLAAIERPANPLFETSIIVPKFSEMEKQAHFAISSSSEPIFMEQLEENKNNSHQNNDVAKISLPKLEIHNSQGELLPLVLELEGKFGLEATTTISKIMAMPKDGNAQILKHVSTPAELFICNEIKYGNKTSFSDKSSPSTPTSLYEDENTLAVFTETELSDWARDEDGGVFENFDELILGTPNITYRRHQRPKKSVRNAKSKTVQDHLRGDFVHVCGKRENLNPPTFALANLDDMDIEFMDTGDDETGAEWEGEAVNQVFLKNSGFIEYVTSEDEAKTPIAETVNSSYPTFTDYKERSQESPVTKNFSFPPEESDEQNTIIPISENYDKFVHRFQERITPFGNVKDSIDTRKLKKSHKYSPLQEATLSEAKSNYTPSQKLEELSRERSNQKNLIHEMVIGKLQLEKMNIQVRKAKRGKRNSLSPFNSTSQNSLSNEIGTDEKKEDAKLVSNEEAISNKENIWGQCVLNENQGESVKVLLNRKVPGVAKYVESFSLPDIRKVLDDEADVSLPSPSLAKLEILKSTESIRQRAKTRARLMSNSELGLSPEDKHKLLKQKIAARKKVRSAYLDYPGEADDFLGEESSYSSKMLDELNRAICKADLAENSDELSFTPHVKVTKDKNRRKSIIQAVSDFFLKKSPTKVLPLKDSLGNASTTNNKLKFKMSLIGKEKSKVKSHANEVCLHPNYASESNLKKKSDRHVPPRPPTPNHYTPSLDKSDENVSMTTIDSLDEYSTVSTSKNLRSSHRKARRENQKKLRMAQEIQRQLEEIEVKQKKLEIKGVNVEKALRNNQNTESEYELMQELLDMIRERNELHKYEQKLMLKAKEIEAEDPYLN